MVAVDFITALGRLLHDGRLRDFFSTDPGALAEQLGLNENDRSAFLQLVPAELEFQANVLLRKRFDQVCELVPETCRRLGEDAWPEFKHYGRSPSLGTQGQARNDAADFCLHLAERRPDAVDGPELNRTRFAHAQTRFSFHFVTTRLGRSNRRLAVQLFLRHRRGWHEWIIYLGL